MTLIRDIRITAHRLIGPAIILLTLIAMLAITWRTWPEPIVDFGRELYVPWQLSQGKVLYRDIAYFNGPLSPYFNSLVFRVFGVSMMSLVYANIAILVGVVILLHRLIRRMADKFTATVACCAFLILLAIGQPGMVGNYNFVTPYSHEMTHGIALSLAAILCMTRFIDTQKRVWIAITGVLLGLVFLTKPEIFIALAIALLVGIRRWLDLAIVIACALAPVLIAMLLLTPALSMAESARQVTGAWRWIFDLQLTQMDFYQRVRGTYDLDETARAMGITLVGYLIVFDVPILVGRQLHKERTLRAFQFWLSSAVVGALLVLLRWHIPWEQVGRPLVLVAVGTTAWLARQATRQSFNAQHDPTTRPESPRGPARDDRRCAPQAVMLIRLIFATFATLLLAKIALRVQFYHYGFALAAPVLALGIMVVMCWIPAWLERTGGSGAVVRGAALAAIGATAGMYVYFDAARASLKTTPVGAGGDLFYCGPTGAAVNQMLAATSARPSGTLAVVPEGAMINYLSRRPNSSPFIVLMPPEVVMFSAQRMRQSFVDHPPDDVLLLDVDVSEYGYASFSADYGKEIADWIWANYYVVTRSSVDSDPRWLLMERRLPQPAEQLSGTSPATHPSSSNPQR